MSTVLSNLTLRQMQEFFSITGTGRTFIRENHPGCEAWCQKISSQLSSPSDAQALELGLRLCHQVPLERPTAAEIASEIVDFRGPMKYHCGCCELKSDTWANIDMVQDMQTITRTEEWTMGNTITPDSPSEGAFAEPYLADEPLCDSEKPTPPPPEPVLMINSPSANYLPPSAQDVPENATVMYYDAEDRPVCQPKGSYASVESVTAKNVEFGSLGTLTQALREGKLSEATDKDEDDQKFNSQRLCCDWPQCEAVFEIVDGEDSPSTRLLSHCRAAHGCHDFGRTTSLLQKISSDHEKAGPDQATPMEAAQLVNFLVNSDITLEDPIVHRIRNAMLDLKANRNTAIAYPAALPSPAIDANAAELSNRAIPQDWVEERVPRSRSYSPMPQGTVRFSALPEDRRPREYYRRRRRRSRSYYDSDDESSDPETDFDIHQPLEEPLIAAFWPFLTQSGHFAPATSNDALKPVLPDASFVPSFHLAAANRFSGAEITASSSTGLFVCGTLMFPSILLACAKHYISEDGIYSTKFQRRLRTSASDWKNICNSIDNAAQQMTPAVIPGLTRHRVKRRPWACARYSLESREDDESQSQSEVHGFVVIGLSEEAYRCLDHWHNEEMPSRLGFARTPPKDTKESAERRMKTLFIQARASAYIEQADGSQRMIRVTTFQCRDHRYSPAMEQNLFGLPQWDVNAFLRSSAFMQLSGATELAQDEEKELAKAMKMRFLLRGDVLCSAVLQEDTEKVKSYLEQGYDVNASCHTYGTALHAAAAKGRDDLVILLVEEGADVNTSGGQYKTPLIAAVVHGREDMARYLLRNRADVLARGGRYVNALYQAVSFEDIAIAHLLLEKGAWLTRDYNEILDLAAENGNRSMIKMLEDYDVRGLTKKKLLQQNPTNVEDDVDDRVTYVPYDERRAMTKPKALTIVRAVVLEAFELKGHRGKWTGIKAVRVLQTALRMGAPESIINMVTPCLSSYEQLIQVISKASQQHVEEQQQLKDGGNIGSPREIASLESSPRSDRSQRSVKRRRRPSPSRTYTADYYSDRPHRPSNGSDVFCLTCDGRGGRAGTERTCNECYGSKTVRTQQGGYSQMMTCPTCQGQGYTFSSRDICRACSNDGAGLRADAPLAAPLSTNGQVRFEEIPPPYSP